MIEISAGFSSVTPLISNWLVSRPLIRAPIIVSMSIRLPTSGSRAAFLIIVVPSATTAAIRIFSVAVTDCLSNTIIFPCIGPSIIASTYPFLSSIIAPSLFSPSRCKLIGLAPMAQPPGRDTLARPRRASRGPSTRTEARIVLTRS